MLPSRTISLQIECPYHEVYEFLAAPRNLLRWSAGMGPHFEHLGGYDWAVERSDGQVVITFAPHNDYGILDHIIAPLEGITQHIHMRLFPNEDGCEINYTLFQQRGVSDAQFASEVEWVTADLGPEEPPRDRVIEPYNCN
jgi:hypothetical protein